MSRMFRVGAIVAAIALLTAACGSSAKKADPATDLATAKASILTKADVPGYTATPHTSDDNIPDSVKKPFATCLKSTVSAFDDVKGAQKADSDDFAKGAATSATINLSAEVKIDPRKSDADKSYSLMSGSSVEGCLATLLFSGLTSSSPADSVKYSKPVVTRSSMKGIDHAVDYTAKVSYTTPKGNNAVYVDLVFAQKDRAEVQFNAFDSDAPFDHATTVALTKKMIDRLGSKAE